VDTIYDYTGRRVKKSAPTGITYFPFNGYEIDPSGTVIKYIRVGVETLAENRGGAKRFYHNDHLGGVNIITDIFAGIDQLNEYDPWGKVSRSEGTAVPKHGFNGKELDPESGLYYYGGRYYDPDLARFISPDPFVQEPGNPQNLNRYSYTLNNPQNYIDPSGYFFDKIFKAIFKAFKSLWEFTKSAWKAVISNPIGRIVLAAVAAIATYGAFTVITGAAYSGTAAGVTAAAAASAQAVMEIPPIRDWLAHAGPGATFAFSLGLNMGFQLGYGYLASPTSVEARPFDYDHAPIEQQANADLILDKGRAINIVNADPSNPGFGSIPGVRAEIDQGLFIGDRLVGLTSKSLGGEHIGIKLLPELMPKDVVVGAGISSCYGICGISHQAVSLTFLQAGLRGSIFTVAQGYTHFLSSFLYGPYGGGASINPMLNPWIRREAD
jgi:RHS repeat-associated protein